MNAQRPRRSSLRWLSLRPARTLVLTVPDSGPRIEAAIAARDLPGVEVAACPDLDSAVARGFAWAQPDGVVLISPAAPSFGQFRDYRDRAGAFARAMKACAARRDPAPGPAATS